jgi:hypothetical protein
MGLPVFLRFRMTSDVATAIGSGGGWYIDNLVINNVASAGCSGGLAKADTIDDVAPNRAYLPRRSIEDIETTEPRTI